MNVHWKKAAITSACSFAAGLLLLCAPAAKAGQWDIEVVDQGAAPRYSSLKIDTAGNVHVAYVMDDGDHYPLRYAFWDRNLNRWFTMTVSTAATFCSLALDSKQRPHISWADFGTASGSKLRYAHWDGQSWNVQAIPLDSDIIGYYTSIALDANDNPSITFYEYRGARESDNKIRLRNVTLSEGYWQVKTIDGQEGSGKFNCSATDAKGNLHIAYANVTSGTSGMRYAYRNGRSWTLDVVEGYPKDKNIGVGHNACIAVDKQSDPHMTYADLVSKQIKYADRKDGRWQIQAVDTVAAVGYPDRNSIALDDEGRPYLGYFDAGRRLLKVAHREGAQWIVEEVDRNGCGFNSSMQIHDGWLWISYADEQTQALKVAHTQLQVSSVLGKPQPGGVDSRIESAKKHP